MKKCFLFLVAVYTLCYCQDANANNGQTALVFPFADAQIVIDGDSSDWPDHLPSYKVNRDFFGNALPDKEDFSAYFKTAYSAKDNAFLVMLEITDDSHINVSDDPETWSQQDSVILYLDAKHSTKGSGSALYLSMGEHQTMNSIDAHWDPSISQANWDNVNGKMKRVGTKTTYEWQFTLAQDLTKTRSIGFDFLITDKDAEDTEENQRTLVMWGPFGGKSSSSTRIGDLLLIKDKSSVGKLKGAIQWAPSLAIEQKFERVRITAAENPLFWLHTNVDDEGNFEIELPEGEYLISSAYTMLGDPWTGLEIPKANEHVLVTVRAGQSTTANTLLVSTQPVPDLIQDKGALQSFDGSKSSEIDQVVQAYMHHFKVPGASIALIKDSKLVYSNVYGVSNNYTGEKVSGSTQFEAASITKAVFAFAVNSLAEKGIIDLDKPLYEYLPFEAIAHDERYKKITARLALSHQTGFPNWAWMNDDGQLDIKFYPGIKYGYSGEGFEYLGKVVSHITKKTLEQVIQEEVLDPLGVNNVYFSDSPQLSELVSHGHFASFAAPISTPQSIGVAHSMHTEAKSFSQFMLGLMAEKGLSNEGYQKMLEPQIEVPTEPEEGDGPWPQRFGLGFHLTNTPLGLAYGHGGNNGDFTCNFVIYKEQGLGFAIFTNSDSGTAFHKKMHEYLIWGKDYQAAMDNL